VAHDSDEEDRPINSSLKELSQEGVEKLRTLLKPVYAALPENARPFMVKQLLGFEGARANVSPVSTAKVLAGLNDEKRGHPSTTELVALLRGYEEAGVDVTPYLGKLEELLGVQLHDVEGEAEDVKVEHYLGMEKLLGALGGDEGLKKLVSEVREAFENSKVSPPVVATSINTREPSEKGAKGEQSLGQSHSTLDCREWALFYYEQGFCVLPGTEWAYLRQLKERGAPEDEIERRAKSPVVKWKEYQDEKLSLLQVKVWFPPLIPRNILLALGKPSGNVYVLDFDSEEFYKRFAEECIKDVEKRTWVAETGTPGHRHVYLRSKRPLEKFRNRKVFYNGKLALEIRADGQVVVAPPSLHHSGRHYRWITDVKSVPIMEVEDLDALLEQWLSKLGVKPYEDEGCMREVAEGLKGKPYRGEDPPCIKKILEGVEEGRRNESAIRLACYLLNLRRLGPEEVLNELLKWNERNKPPLPPSEIRSVVKSAVKGRYPYGCRSMRDLGFCTPEDRRRCPLRPEFEIVPLKQLVEEAKPLEYICKPLIPKRSLILLAGKAGVGKSFISLHMAHAVASSSKVFDHFEVVEGSKVLIIDEENGPSTYKERVQLMGLNPLDNIDCLSLSGFKLDNSNHLKFLERAIESKGYKLVVLDNWTDLVSKVDENKAVEVSNILSALRRMAYERDCTFILVHHLRKNLPYLVNEIDELRGSSALVNEPDLVYLVQADEATGHRIVKAIKNRHGEELAFRLAFETRDGKLAIKWVGEVERSEVESDVIECAKIIKDYVTQKGTAKRSEIINMCKKLGYSERTADRALRYLADVGVLERPKRGVYRPKKTPVLPVLPEYYNSTGESGKTGTCAVCKKPGGKPHVTDKGVVYLHEECEGKYEGKL
jgi:RecA/RadA recombinase